MKIKYKKKKERKKLCSFWWNVFCISMFLDNHLFVIVYLSRETKLWNWWQITCFVCSTIKPCKTTNMKEKVRKILDLLKTATFINWSKNSTRNPTFCCWRNFISSSVNKKHVVLVGGQDLDLFTFTHWDFIFFNSRIISNHSSQWITAIWSCL